METIEFWLAVNDEGNCALSLDSAADAMSKCVDEHGGAAVRTVGMMVRMALPTGVEAEPLEVFEDAVGDTEAEIEEVETAEAA